jgi:dihydropteroate synthase
MEGCGKSAKGWFDLSGVNVSYDCPFHIDLDHAVNIDFVNEAKGPGARVAVELTPESARRLVKAILAALEEAEVDGWLSETGEHTHGHEAIGHAEVALQRS